MDMKGYIKNQKRQDFLGIFCPIGKSCQKKKNDRLDKRQKTKDI